MLSVCAMCSASAPFTCARCASVFYCNPAHQKEDWKEHKIQCPRLAQEALATVFHPVEESYLLRITACLAKCGYNQEVGLMVQLSKAFWWDEQIWDAFKDVPGPGGVTRLMYAAFKRTDRVRWFLARGAQVNISSLAGYTSLMSASQSGHLEISQILIDKGANVNAATKEGGTALMWASEKGHCKTSRLLLNKGAYVNAARSDNGHSALMLASAGGHLEITRMLIEQGATVNAARFDNGMTALMFSAMKGHLDVSRCLIDKGANVKAARIFDGYTALMWLCEIDPVQKGNFFY